MACDRISDTGITVAYEPQGSLPIVDIVFVHGLLGHPFGTWASKRTTNGDPGDEAPPKRPHSPQISGKSKIAGKKVLPQLKSLVSGGAKVSSKEPGAGTPYVFWPRDLLPAQCPQARILVFGYDAMVTKYLAGATNKNSIFSHSKDLLYELSRFRPLKRRLIFVAHSLGGIVVKEMFANCSTSNSGECEDIPKSTAAVIFLGTPHRGSTAAGIGEVARKAASILMIDTNSSLLDSLSLKNSDLERSQDVFVSLWHKYDFRVKTFQEGLPLTAINISPLNQKTVSDTSSCLGDPRERAETLQANHREMCRFTAASEPNFRKVVGELRGIYLSLISLIGHNENPDKSQLFYGRELSQTEKKCLNSLRFPGMLNRQQTIDNPIVNTGRWLIQTPTYTNWIDRQNMKEHFGLFQIIGKPGSGKSTLMKKTFDQVYSRLSGPNVCVASFFFHRQGSRLQHSLSGLFRSLLYQTLPFHNDQFQSFISLHLNKEGDDNHKVEWHQSELQSAFHSIFSKPGLVGRTIIFIDALDECDNANLREVAYYFREITISAHDAGVELDICISRRHYPPISLTHCPEVRMEDFNAPDIQRYIGLRFEIAGLGADDRWNALGMQVLQRSDGVFLWVILVVDMLLKERDLGMNMKYLDRRTKELPGILEQLFIELLRDIHPTERQTTLRLFQWVLLATGPLRLREWHHILAFIREPPPSSLREWRESDHYTETDDQLERQIRSISRGLVEVKAQRDFELEMEDCESIGAGAGSLDSTYGDSRLIQPIHESVREFFLREKGFSLFDESLHINFAGCGHLTLLSCCLDYLNIRELDAFINARLKSRLPLPAPTRFSNPPDLLYTGAGNSGIRRSSVASFGSSASCHSTGSSNAGIYSPLWRDIPLDLRRTDTSPRGDEPSCLVSAAISVGFGQFGESPRDIDHKRMKHNADSREDAGDKLSAPAVPRRPSFVRSGGADHYTSLPELPLQNSRSLGSIRAYYEQQSLPDKTVGGMAEGYQKYYPLEEWVTDSSVTGKSQTLEDYPALQSYAVNKVFIHAKLAEREGADPSGVVKKLLDTAAWTRWVSLQENITEERSLLSFVAEQGLVTWIEKLVKLKGNSENFGDVLGDTLISTIKRGDQKVMGSLVQAGACDSRGTPRRKSPLHHIILSSNCELLKFFWINIEARFAGFRQQKIWEILDWQDEAQFSPLHLAIKNGHLSMAEELVKYGADVNLRSSAGDTSLHLSTSGDSACVEDKTRELDTGVSSKASSTEMPAFRAPETHLSLVKLLLNRGALVNTYNNRRRTPLHSAAARNCNCGVVEVLLRYGADKDTRDSSEDTPLHLAAETGSHNTVGVLLDHGVDINAQNKDKKTPLHLAAELGHYNTVEKLLEHGADVDSTDESGATPLWHAISLEYRHVVFALLKHGANAQKGGRNPLTVALTLDDSDIAKELLNHGAKIDRNSLLSAVQEANYKMMERCIDCGADVNVGDISGDTPLHYACSRSRNLDAKFCKLLLENGADPFIENQSGKTPYDRAIAGGLSVQLTLLEQHMVFLY